MIVNIFGEPGCAKCEAARISVDTYLRTWGMKATVHVIDTGKPAAADELDRLGADLSLDNNPTIVAEEGGKVVGRWTGIIPEGEPRRGQYDGDLPKPDYL